MNVCNKILVNKNKAQPYLLLRMLLTEIYYSEMIHADLGNHVYKFQHIYIKYKADNNYCYVVFYSFKEWYALPWSFKHFSC